MLEHLWKTQSVKLHVLQEHMLIQVQIYAHLHAQIQGMVIL